MTYLVFHLIFTLPPIGLLALSQRQPLAGIGGFRAWLGLLLIVFLAVVYTTPWDNYLVWREVWSYGRDRVLGVIGYVPIEEYLFFVLQPILTGLWLYWLLSQQRLSLDTEPNNWAKIVGAIVWGALSIAGAWMLQQPAGVYLGLILAWAGPILALQWAIGGGVLWAAKRVWFVGMLVPTLYLWVADRIAIGQGIWEISEFYTTGVKLFGLPMEEATFFWVTNLLVVQGLLLVLLLGRVPASQLQTEG